MELLSVENVTFRYPKAASDALRGVSLSVSDGQWAVLCGLSGCGKSTLLRLIKRELAPFGKMSGRILFNGDAATGIGIVLQDPESQIVTDEVWHELAFGLENLGLPSDTIRRRVAEMASFFGIEGWYHRKTYELSGGQKQLLNLASALVMNPRLLLLDEPTAQLDPIAATEFRNVLTRINRDLGVTILMAEHRLEDVMPLADRIFLMDKGSVASAGTPAEVSRYLYVHNHPMTEALPAATRVYFAITGRSVGSGETTPAGDPAIPFTVRDGRAWLAEIFHSATTPSVADFNATAQDKDPFAETSSDCSRRSNSEASVASVQAQKPGGSLADKTPAGKTVLEARDLRFRYAKQLPDVLSGASITLRAGEHYCLLGGNGSGKTTLLSLLAGLTRPYAGSVRLFGRKMTAFKPGELYRNNLALLPQQPRDVFVEKTIREDLLKAYKRTENESAMLQLCERLRITDILDSHPYDVSGGELQKAALAKVLASRPKILLLDEPTKGIDVRGKHELAGLLDELRGEGLAVLSVTHDAEWAAEHADRCGLLFDGEVISEGRARAFFADNAFYTTAANRMARGIVDGAITVGDVIRACCGIADSRESDSRDDQRIPNAASRDATADTAASGDATADNAAEVSP